MTCNSNFSLCAGAASLFSSCQTVVVFPWISGLLVGLLSAVSADSVCTSVMRSALFCSTSEIGILLVCFVPVLILIIFCSCRWAVAFLMFAEALSFAFCGGLIQSAFGPAAWLAQLLLMPNSFLLPFLFWFALVSTESCQSSSERNVFVVLSAAVLIAAIYYFAVFPLGIKL